MSKHRHFFFFSLALALLLAPYALTPQLARAQVADYIVDTINDNPFNPALTYCDPSIVGDCSLRQAIGEAKRDNIESLITFDVAGVINLNPAANGELVIDTPNLTIDADDPIEPLPVIQIDGGGSSYPAIKITTNNTTIKGLSITGFSGLLPPGGAGILIDGTNATTNTISLNHIGVEPDGSTAAGNVYGVRIIGGATNNTISGNFIGGSTIAGISIENSSSNIIQSNGIGIGAGDSVLGNNEAGIIILSNLSGTSTGNVIGGTSSSLSNTISGNGPIVGVNNTKAGILLQGSGTTGNFIRANRIGLDAGSTGTDGLTAVPNKGDGIRIEAGSSNNQITGTNGAAVVVSGNSGYGIRITGAGTTGNQIIGGVFVGLNRTRNGGVANTRGGISIDNGATNTTINGSSSAFTLIAGHTSANGIMVSGATTTGTEIRNSYIGIVPDPVTSSGSLSFANAGGVVVNNARQTTLSTNTISANTLFGVRLTNVTTTTLSGNFIGLDLARTAAQPNVGPGIEVITGTNTLIGGTTGNYIAGNTGPGIHIGGTTTISTTISGNSIGLRKNLTADTTYTVGAGNSDQGILISNGPKVTTITNNTVAASGTGTDPGIAIQGSATTTVTLSLNKIGWVPGTGAGTPPPQARPNSDGIAIEDASQISISDNTIQLNSANAVRVSGTAHHVQVVSNTLGLNTAQGVLVEDSARRVTILSNKMTGNGGGIDLDGTTIYSGSGTDPDGLSLPNHGIDPPVTALASPLRLRMSQDGRVEGYVYTDTKLIKLENAINPPSACITCTIQFFRSADGVSDGQGYVPLKIEPIGGGAASDFAVADAEGYFSGRLVGATPLPEQLLFTATDGYGNTSEFGVFTVNAALSLTHLNPATGAQDAKPSDTISYTLRLENTGTIELNDIEFTTSGTLDGWTVARTPSANPLTLDAGDTATLTVTLTLPTGTNANAAAGKIDTTVATVTSSDSITISRNLVTTVLSAPVLIVEPTQGTGSAPPGEDVSYAHKITNIGNITVTLDLASITTDPAESNKIWQDTLNGSETISMTLDPGESGDVVVNVEVPVGAQDSDSQGNPFIATTLITGTGRAPFGSVTVLFSDTTRVTLVPDAEMDEANINPQQAASGEEVIFFHTVRNTSNGVTSFKLNYRTNSGSTVRFETDNNVPINSEGVFTLDNVFDPANNRTNVLRFKAIVTVTDTLLPGAEEQINIWLTHNTTGESIGGAAVVDIVQITSSPVRPRLWLPIIANNAPPAAE